LKKKRQRSPNVRRHAQKLHSDDGVDPQTYFRNPSGRDDRKDLQLCRQVGRTIEMTLGDFGDDVLSGLLVEAVVPAPNAGQLLVTVRPMFADQTPVGEILERLERVSGSLRTEITRSINRKKTPRLLFQVVAAPVLPAEPTKSSETENAE
jgi:ribosome-binding factor A